MPPTAASRCPPVRQRVQRSALNTQCKLLLLTHAFEKLNALR
jgi:hypothetical protein